jgi:hypothetical protein
VLSSIADIVTIGSFLVTIVVTLVTINTQHKVSELQKKNLLLTRTPEHLKILKNSLLDINTLANNFTSNKRDISVILVKVKSEIKHSVSILPKQFRITYKEYTRKLEEFETLVDSTDEKTEKKANDTMWKCINLINEIINDQKNTLQNYKKEIK